MKIKSKKVKFISIKDKLVIYFLAIFFIAGGFVITFIYINSKNALLDRTFEQLTSIKYVKKKQVEKYFSERLNEVTVIKRNALKINSDSLPAFLNTQIANSNHFFGFSVLHIKNNRIISIERKAVDVNLEFHDKEWIDGLNSETIHLTEIIDSTKEQKYNLFYLFEVDSLHVVGLCLSTSDINNIMIENNPKEGLGKSGESYLVGSDRFLRTSSRFVANSIFKIKVKTESTNRAFNSEIGTLITNDYRGIKVLSSFAQLNIKGLNWALVAEIDSEEALIPVTEIKRKILFITIFFSLAIFIVIYVISNRITRPLIRLTEAARKIGAGEFYVNPIHSSNDEIGQLIESFAIMSEQLKEWELALKEERLKRFSIFADAQELEKQRISKELHDGLGQYFSAIKLKLESIEDHNPDNTKLLNDVKTGLDSTIDELRRISNNLMPVALMEFGITTAIRNLCRQLAETAKISIIFDATFEDRISDEQKNVYIFRIVQEALNNVIKHSKAKNVEVILSKDQNYQLIVTDDGIGFDYNNALKGSGSGIYNIRERVLALKGKFNIETEPLKGTIIICNIPIA